ncbi:LysM peptidoglycan-binding domain-containing protein [Rubrivirga sp. S365]|uniref:LysM peptidoglycan-binding domain-containing protein n=1 Tax=Rubrivirga litoralis TaxID=3075598 RepID=A0ABU3BQS4_9BACT|nr:MULTISPECIES: LysM peptidoglycan-binding domain-containing protein [unclassified Rubrivirga]MDT0631642.1 LysM peptidoglycan-binding domain-containing protein [Rubrivirga sp. F394]MDT7855615.1 LysM peptidoglycan-binding domain-containing protein [Rubrivirga sp. S365]
MPTATAVRFRPALAALLLLLASAPAGAQVAERLADLRLATAVRLALVDDARTRPFDVSVTARGGVVEVEGAVPDADRAALRAIALGVPGVRRLAGDAPAGARPLRPAPPASSGAAPPAERDRAAAPRSAEPAGGAAYHVVRPGDTLFSLARRYETTVEEVLRLNGLRSPSISVGQRLRVR